MNQPFSIVGLVLVQRLLPTDGREADLCRSGTQRLTAAAQPVQNPVPRLWVLGGKPVHDTTCWGEQTGKRPPALIRRRFVPALTGRLTTKAENTPSNR
ncbi:hypothetical protein EOD08_03440 [Mesorhizobium sp. M6A.T.Ca.TU.002.02.2.1]|nr:hypothetical protein EOD08_03440 [Mesorhizobium sp. M6A.T.Ca.TU.002.02.2.1]